MSVPSSRLTPTTAGDAALPTASIAIAGPSAADFERLRAKLTNDLAPYGELSEEAIAGRVTAVLLGVNVFIKANRDMLSADDPELIAMPQAYDPTHAEEAGDERDPVSTLLRLATRLAILSELRDTYIRHGLVRCREHVSGAIVACAAAMPATEVARILGSSK